MEAPEKLIFNDPRCSFVEAARTARATGLKMFAHCGFVYSTQTVALLLNIHDGNLGKYEEAVMGRALLFKVTSTK